MGHSAEGVTSLDHGNNGRVGEPSFDNSLGSYFYSMTTAPEESSRDESPQPTTFSREATSAHIELHPRLHYPRIGESFIVNPTAKATFSDATSSDSTSEQKWALSPLDYLVIKQSRLGNKGRQNYNKVNENEGVEKGSSSTQQETILSHTRSNGLGRFSSAHDNSDDVGRNGVKSYQGKVQSVFTSKNIKLETTPDFSASSSTTGTTVGFDAPIPSVLIEVEKGRYDENQDKKENPTTRITERSKSNTHTTTPFHLPYRVPFPYVSRANNEDGYKKEEAKPQNTNDMTDPSQTLVNKAVTLLQRRNRSRRNIVESGVAAQEEHETVLGSGHQHNSNETEAAMESLDHSQVANVKNTTHAPSSNPLEALERLTRLLEKMLRQLSQFRQKFTLRLIRMTEREDIDQMQEIMKDFDISGEKPIFFIAGGLRKLNIDTRTTTTSDVQEEDTTSSVSTEQLIATAGSVEPLYTTTTIGPLLDLPETTVLPVEPETETFDNEKGSDMIINRDNNTSNNESNVEQISTGNPSTAERLLSRHTRSDIEAEDQVGINFNTFPIPGRSARTENPYDDDDQEQYYEIFPSSQNFDLRYDGDSNHADKAGESITSLNFSPLHPIDQSHMQRNDYIRLNEAISSGDAISIAPKLEKASISPSPSSISHYTTDERILPLDGSISLQEENERSNDQGKYQAHAAGLNNINLASPSPFPSSNIDQDQNAHEVSIPLSRNNEKLSKSNPENLNLAAQTLFENERSSNPVHYKLILDTPTLFKAEVEEKDAGSSLKTLSDQGPSISNESSKEQKEILDSSTKHDAGFKVSSQKDVLENKALLESAVVNRPVSLFSENITKSSQTTNDINLLPGSIAKSASPLQVLPNKSNNLNHETPRRLAVIEPEENKKYNGEVVATVTKAELQSNVLSAGEPTGESIKGTLPTPNVVVDMSLTSEGTPQLQLQRTLSSSVNKLSSEQEISGTELKPISPLISNNAPFPVGTEESFSGFTNKLEKRPADIILDGDREAETDIRKKSLGESQRNLVAEESVGDMKKVGKNVEQQKIGKGMEVTLNETTFRPPTGLEKHQIMGNKTSSPLDKASNITFIQKNGIDTADQSLMKVETDNHVRNVVVPNPPQKNSLHNSRSTDNISTTQSIVAPLVSHEGVTNPTVTNTLAVETDKEKTSHPSVQTPTTQPEKPASQITPHETVNVLVESQPEPILDSDALLSSDGLRVSKDKNIEAVTSEKQTVAEIDPGTLPIKAHTDSDIVPPVQSANIASDVDTVQTYAIPDTLDSNKPSPLKAIPEVGIVAIPPPENPISVVETAPILEIKRISTNVVTLDEPAKQLISNEVANPTLTNSLDNNSVVAPLKLDPLVPATNAVNVAPVNDVVHVDPVATTNDIVNVNSVAHTDHVVKIDQDVAINEGLKVEPELAATEVAKVEPPSHNTVKVEPVIPDKDLVHSEPGVPVIVPAIEVVKVDSVVPTDDILKVDSVVPPNAVLNVEPVATVNEVVKVEPIVPVSDVVTIQPVVPVNNVVKVEPIAQVTNVVQVEPVEQVVDVVKVEPVEQVVDVVKVEPVEQVVDVVKVEPVEQVVDVVKVEPIAQVANVVKVEPVAQVADVVKVEPIAQVADVVKVEPVVPVNDVLQVKPVSPISDVVKVEPVVPVNEGVKVEPVTEENGALEVGVVAPVNVVKVEPVVHTQVSDVILAEPLAQPKDIKVEPEVAANDVVKLEPVSPANDVLKVDELAVPNTNVVKVDSEVPVNNVVNVEPLVQVNTALQVEPVASINNVITAEQAVHANDVLKAEPDGPATEVSKVETHVDIPKVEPLILAKDVKVEPVVAANDAVEVGQPFVVNDLVKVDSVVPEKDDLKVEPLIPVDGVVKVEPTVANNDVKVDPLVPEKDDVKVEPLIPADDVVKVEPISTSNNVKVEPVVPAKVETEAPAKDTESIHLTAPVEDTEHKLPTVLVKDSTNLEQLLPAADPVNPIIPVSSVVTSEPVIPVISDIKVAPAQSVTDVVKVDQDTAVGPIIPASDSDIVKEVPVIPDNNIENIDPLIPTNPIIDIVNEEKLTPVSEGVKEVPAVSVNDVIEAPKAPLNLDPVIPFQGPVTNIPEDENLNTEPKVVVASANEGALKDPDTPLNEEVKAVPEPPIESINTVENIVPEKPLTLTNDALSIQPDNSITPAIPVTSPITLDSPVKTVPEVPIVADNNIPALSELVTSPSDKVKIVSDSEPLLSEGNVENLPGLLSETPKVVAETPVEVPAAPDAPIEPLEILNSSPMIPPFDSLEQIGDLSTLGTVSNVVPQETLSEPSTPVAFQSNLPTGDEISIMPNIPETDPDASFGIKPIETKPHLQIPGLRPTLPERPHPEYLDFISQGVDEVSLTSSFLPDANVPVVVSSPPVLSSYSPLAILKKQQQLLQTFFSGVLYRKDADM
ncbi:unnamed protein product [Orchesella dallaii]|uniref:Uncharacterized protein n=1 Tax=Orchesella dallaii TaxID=48710 RepID=A0ABP1QA99_9HEXA